MCQVKLAQLCRLSSSKCESVWSLGELVNKDSPQFCALDIGCILDVMPHVSVHASKMACFKSWNNSLTKGEINVNITENPKRSGINEFVENLQYFAA